MKINLNFLFVLIFITLITCIIYYLLITKDIYTLFPFLSSVSNLSSLSPSPSPSPSLFPLLPSFPLLTTQTPSQTPITTSLNLPIISLSVNLLNIQAWYDGYGPFLFDSSSKIIKWNDKSSNKNHITSEYFRGNVKKVSINQGKNGLIGNNILYGVSGDNISGLYFPFNLKSNSYTFCYIARYTGDLSNTTYNRRIFDARDNGTTGNTLWGFNGGINGRSHNGQKGWYTTLEKKMSDPDNWIIGIETENTARYNGLDCTNNYTQFNPSKQINSPERPTGNYNPIPSINFGKYTGQTNSDETSNWEVLELIFYNIELSLEEKQKVENYLTTKYGHISFKCISPTIEDFYTNASKQITLYDKWFNIYDGNKWGYSKTNNLWYGPGLKGFDFYNKNNYYFWIRSYTNSNRTSNTYLIGDRNEYKQIYSFIPPDIKKYKMHLLINGGGGGGGESDESYSEGSYAGGGGAGGQVAYYNIIDMNNINLTIQVGNSGNGGFFNTYQFPQKPGAGGDSIITWGENYLQGLGGKEGRMGSVIGEGGKYVCILSEATPNILVGQGGSGSRWSRAWGGQGGAISSVTTTINIYENITLWSIFQLTGIALDTNYLWWGPTIWGVGGCGSRGSMCCSPMVDMYPRNGTGGGAGFVIIVLDYN